MKKIKLLMPILGVCSIVPTAIPMASCSCTTTRKITVEGDVVTFYEATDLYDNFVIVMTSKDVNKKVTGVSKVTIGSTQLSSLEYSCNNNKVTISRDILSKYNGDIVISPILEDAEIKIEGIVVSKPTLTEYYEGDDLDLTGLVVKAKMSDGTFVPITEGYTTIPANGTTLTTDITKVLVTYSGFTTSFDISVKSAEVEIDAWLDAYEKCHDTFLKNFDDTSKRYTFNQLQVDGYCETTDLGTGKKLPIYPVTCAYQTSPKKSFNIVCNQPNTAYETRSVDMPFWANSTRAEMAAIIEQIKGMGAINTYIKTDYISLYATITGMGEIYYAFNNEGYVISRLENDIGFNVNMVMKIQLLKKND